MLYCSKSQVCPLKSLKLTFILFTPINTFLPHWKTLSSCDVLDPTDRDGDRTHLLTDPDDDLLPLLRRELDEFADAVFARLVFAKHQLGFSQLAW